MMISFIVILSFAVQTISSLSVQGSLSMPDDETVSIDLIANKSNNEVDELVEKLRMTRRIRLTVDLDGKINIQQAMLEINDRINRYQDYLVVNFNKVINSINIAAPNMMKYAMNSISLRKSDLMNVNIEIMLRKLICAKSLLYRTLQKSRYARNIIYRMCVMNLISTDEENKSSIDRNHSKTRLRYDTTTEDQIVPKMETRILRYSTLMTDIDDNNYKKNSANKNIDQDNLFVTKFSDPENRFRLPKDIPVLSSSKNKTSVTGDKWIKISTSTVSPLSHIMDRGNSTTHIPKIFARRTFQASVPWNKDQTVQNQPHVSKIKIEKISTIDEILKAVYQVLPTEKPAKIPSKTRK